MRRFREMWNRIHVVRALVLGDSGSSQMIVNSADPEAVASCTDGSLILGAGERPEVKWDGGNARVMTRENIAVSGPITANGSAQTFAHGLDGAPVSYFAFCTSGHDGGGAGGTQAPDLYTDGGADGTNVTTTMTAGCTYRVVAFG